VGKKTQVVDRTLAAIEVVEPYQKRADKKLIVPVREVHSAIVLVSAAAAGLDKIEDAPIRDTIWASTGRLPDLVACYVPSSQPITWDEGAAVCFRHNISDSRSDAGSAENLSCNASGILLHNVLFEFRSLESLRA